MTAVVDHTPAEEADFSGWNHPILGGEFDDVGESGLAGDSGDSGLSSEVAEPTPGPEVEVSAAVSAVGPCLSVSVAAAPAAGLARRGWVGPVTA